MLKSKQKIHFFRILWVVFIFLLILGQLQRIQVSARIAFYLHDVLILIWVLAAAAAAVFGFNKNSDLSKNRKKVLNLIKSKAQTNKWFLAFLVFGSFSLFVNQVSAGFSLKPWLYLARLIVYLLFALSLLLPKIKKQLIIPFKQKPIKLIPLSVITGGVLAAVIAWIQYWLMPDARHLAQFGWDVHYYRLMGFYLDPNFTGLILSISLVNLYRNRFTNPFKNKPDLNFDKHSLVKKILLVFAYLIMISAVLFTYSRSGYLAFLGSLSMITFFNWINNQRGKAVRLVLVGLVFLGCLPLLPRPGGEGVNLKRTSTVESRVSSSQSSLFGIKGFDWVWGQGIYNSSLNQPDEEGVKQERSKPVHAHFPDNILVFILSSTGLIGLALFIAAGIDWVKKLLKSDYYQLIILLAAMGHSLINLSLHEPFTLLWVLTSLSFSSSINKNLAKKITVLKD